MSRVCIFVSYVITLVLGALCGFLLWTSLGQWLMVSVYGASGDTRLWGVRIITVFGVGGAVIHFHNFWTWYFDSFQELVTRHRLLFSMTAPGLSEESHTIGQILFAVLYSFTSWILTTGAFLLGLLFTINIARGWWGRDAVLLGSFIGLFVGMGLSGGISTVVDRMFSINRLQREIELGLFARLFGGGGRPRGTKVSVVIGLILAITLLLVLALVAVAAPTVPSSTQGGVDVIGWVWGIFLHGVAIWLSVSYLTKHGVPRQNAFAFILPVAFISGVGTIYFLEFDDRSPLTLCASLVSFLWAISMFWVWKTENLVSENVPRGVALVATGASGVLFLALVFTGGTYYTRHGTYDAPDHVTVVYLIVFLVSFLIPEIVKCIYNRRR